MNERIKILYVEDEEEIRSHTVDILGELFSKDDISVATNGEEGLEVFKSHRPDIVMSDIQMPKMNGLEMIEEIKKIDPNVRVIVTTAHSDSAYLIRSIDYGVNRYILKPYKIANFVEQVQKSIDGIKNRRLADLYRKKEEREKLNKLQLKSMKDSLDSIPLPCVVCCNKKSLYLNSRFLDSFDEEIVKISYEGNGTFDKVLEKRDGYIQSIYEVVQGDVGKKASILTRGGRKIFQIHAKPIELSECEERATIFSFVDITLSEYQKLKIEQNYKSLKELYFKRSVKKYSDTKAVETLSKKRELIDALSYKEQVGSSTFDELAELSEIDDELEDLLYMVDGEYTGQILERMSSRFLAYAKTIYALIEFEELGRAIEEFAQYLSKVAENEIEESKIPLLNIYLENIAKDLKSWRVSIFVEANTRDIHYLDESLMSSALQFQADMESKGGNDDDMGLDLF